MTMTLALRVTSRCSQISYVNINFMAKTETKNISSVSINSQKFIAEVSPNPLKVFTNYEQDKP